MGPGPVGRSDALEQQIFKGTMDVDGVMSRESAHMQELLGNV